MLQEVHNLIHTSGQLGPGLSNCRARAQPLPSHGISFHLWRCPRDKFIYRCGKPTSYLPFSHILLQHHLTFSVGGRVPVLPPLEGGIFCLFTTGRLKCNTFSANQSPLSSTLVSRCVLPPASQLKGGFLWRTKCKGGRSERSCLHLFSHSFIHLFIQLT